MTDESPVVSIEIIKEVPFEGDRDSLHNRLRNVSLRGFPDVKIYTNAVFESVFLTPEQIEEQLHTPQPAVYQTPNLERIARLARLFKDKGIDICNLTMAYDYTAIHASGQVTEWTILPPIVERFQIPKTKDSKFDYLPLLADSLKASLQQRNLWLNPEALALDNTSDSGFFDLINDGAHRIHYGFENKGIRILRISGITPGFPYYAVPQPYKVLVYKTREESLKEKDPKIHIVQSPGHKDLYRVFPSGGIKSGDVRPIKF
jgi:hypothetical protein